MRTRVGPRLQIRRDVLAEREIALAGNAAVRVAVLLDDARPTDRTRVVRFAKLRGADALLTYATDPRTTVPVVISLIPARRRGSFSGHEDLLCTSEAGGAHVRFDH